MHMHENRKAPLNGPPTRAFASRPIARLQHDTLLSSGQVARMLHDGITQELWYSVLLSKRLLEALSVQRINEAKTLAQDLGSLLDSEYVSVRRMIAELVTSSNPQSFAGALRDLIEQFSHVCGEALHLAIDWDAANAVPPDAASDLAHITHEAIFNVIKHAQATSILLAVTRDDAGIAVSVADNGCGFGPDSGLDGTHLGLHTVRERAQRIGAALIIESTVNYGTRINVRLNNRCTAGRDTGRLSQARATHGRAS